MYKNLAVLAGILVAILIFFNGLAAKAIGLYNSNLIYHFIGLVIILIVAFVKKNKGFSLRKIPLIFILPGILNVTTVVLNSVCMNKIGITMTIALSMLGQLIISNIIDHFGLFSMPVVKFKKKKLIGFSIIGLGVLAMVWL
jgi:transporter family-2 protein